MTAPIAAIGAARNDCDKIGYTTRSAAKQSEKRGRKLGRDHMGVYLHDVCGRWHVGHALRIGRPLPSQSAKRKVEQRERSKMIARRWPDGAPMCAYPNCERRADDVHELLSRARGGSIADEANTRPLCRTHHDYITTHPLEAAAEGWALSRGVA